MAWWNRRREEREASLVASMATAFATALGSVLTAQTEGIRQQGQFLNTLQDLSARKAAQVLGSKGGRQTARRKAERKKALEAPSCALCENPMRRGVTMEMINLHRQHGDREPQEQRALPFDQNGVASTGEPET
jgi:hypothetical protein